MSPYFVSVKTVKILERAENGKNGFYKMTEQDTTSSEPTVEESKCVLLLYVHIERERYMYRHEEKNVKRNIIMKHLIRSK
jgi:hypothetical protein